MKKKLFSIFIGFVALMFSCNQKNVSKNLQLKGPFLGQKPPGDVPELFASGIVSSVYFEHSGAVFTPDGKELFWSRAINEGREPRIIVIMHMKMENGVWSRPELAPFNFNNGMYTVDISGAKIETITTTKLEKKQPPAS